MYGDVGEVSGHSEVTDLVGDFRPPVPLLSKGVAGVFFAGLRRCWRACVTASRLLSPFAILNRSVSASIRTVALGEALTPDFEATRFAFEQLEGNHHATSCIAKARMRAARPRLTVVPQRLPWMMPWSRRCSLRRVNCFQTFAPPPLMRYLPSGSGQMTSLTNLFGPVAAAVPFHEAVDSRLDLMLPLGAVFQRQVEEQMAVHHLALTTRQRHVNKPQRTRCLAGAATAPDPREPLRRACRRDRHTQRCKPNGSSRWATKGRPINFAKSTASMMLVACVTERYLLPPAR